MSTLKQKNDNNCPRYSFASSTIKNIVRLFSRFLVKFIYCIAFGSASSICCLLKCIAYNSLWSSYSLANNHSCHDLLDLLQFLECYHMFLNLFLLFNEESFVHRSKHILFLHMKENIICNLFDDYHYQKINKKSIYSLKTWVI